jgi:hypothetical protein
MAQMMNTISDQRFNTVYFRDGGFESWAMLHVVCHCA